ncbi:MAG: FAD-binding oxidoreductase, partial [Christensenellales bacterium]
MANAQKIISDLQAILGADKVVTDPEALRVADGPMTRRFERAFGYKPEHLPICVVTAYNTQDVSQALKYCNDNGVYVVTKTGSTCSEDQLVLINDNSIYLDASPINQLIDLDEENMMATVGCGMPLAQLEKLANEKGLTTGHCPQSQPLAFMGGLTATRSIGQFSTYYGGIEDLVCGLEAVLPNGEIVRIRNVPRRASGPDLRHLFIGSEGTLAVMTEITVKLFTYYPDDMWKGGFIVRDFQVGLDCIREIIVKGYRPSVVRLYDKPDVDRNYGSVDLKDEEAFMFFVAEGPPALAAATGEAIIEISAKYDARFIGTAAVDHWLDTRNDVCDTIGSEEEQESLRQTGAVYATVEISAKWSELKDIYRDVMANVPPKFDNLAIFGGHVSHSYQTGSNIYFIYEMLVKDPLNAHNEQWELIKAICEEVIKYPTGGICHHHGVGKIRVKMIDQELGTSLPLMQGLKDMLDP